MRPKQSYTIWFSQRTGSTLLSAALSSTGVAGHPNEWLLGRDPFMTSEQDVEWMLAQGTTSNGIFGLKTSFQPDRVKAFREMYDLPDSVTDAKVWSEAFPNCDKHIYMTRRNKVRLAVSWWRAIVSGEWHREHGEKPKDQDIASQYNYDAIRHLFKECSLREAAMEEFFAEEGIIPLTIVYEDFIRDYEGTVLKVLDYLNVPTEGVVISEPRFDRIADEVSEAWVQRFRQESQQEDEKPAW